MSRFDWWACNRCGERQLTSKRGKVCALTPRCGGKLTVGPHEDSGHVSAREEKG